MKIRKIKWFLVVIALAIGGTTAIIYGCSLIPWETKTIVHKTENVDAQATSCLLMASKCLDIDYITEDGTLDQNELGLLVENTFSCWEAWQSTGCDGLLDEIPVSKSHHPLKMDIDVNELINSGELKIPELPENPYLKKGKGQDKK